jgi:hypothetical protein
MPIEAMPATMADELGPGPGFGTGAMGCDATTPGAAFKPWLAMTRRRVTQPEPATRHKNVVEPS